MQRESEVGPMRKVVHYVQIYHFAKFEYFWATGRCLNLNSKFGRI
jgi:hypothetical protein